MSSIGPEKHSPIAKTRETGGWIIVFTGNGKGKTTASLGMALRAVGHDFHILMIQFIKGARQYGELEAARRLHPYFKIVRKGRGLTNLRHREPTAEDIRIARDAWDFSKREIASGKFDMIILDEINYVIDFQLIPVEEVLQAIGNKPQMMHLVLTGRNAHPKIIEIADLVTEMKELKHPYTKGIKAQKGIEY